MRLLLFTLLVLTLFLCGCAGTVPMVRKVAIPRADLRYYDHINIKTGESICGEQITCTGDYCYFEVVQGKTKLVDMRR